MTYDTRLSFIRKPCATVLMVYRSHPGTYSVTIHRWALQQKLSCKLRIFLWLHVLRISTSVAKFMVWENPRGMVLMANCPSWWQKRKQNHQDCDSFTSLNNETKLLRFRREHSSCPSGTGVRFRVKNIFPSLCVPWRSHFHRITRLTPERGTLLTHSIRVFTEELASCWSHPL